MRHSVAKGAFTGKFEFNVSDGNVLNLMGKEYQYLHFPGAETVNAAYDAQRAALRTLAVVFKSGPKAAKDGKEKEGELLFGNLLLSDDDGFKWRQFAYSLHGAELRIRKPRKSKEDRKELLYSFSLAVPLMQRAPLGFPLVTIVRVFLRNGNVFTVRCQKEEDTQKLAKALKALWKRRYSPDEIAARARVIPEYRTGLLKLLRLCLKKFTLFTRAFWAYSPPSLIRSGHVNHVVDGRVRPLFGELTAFCLVLLLPRKPGEEHRNVDTFIPLNLVQLIDHEQPDMFYLKTSFKVYLLQVPHTVAKKDWMLSIRAILNGSVHQSATPETAQDTSTYPNKGFTYSQPLAHRMSILHQNTGRVWKLSGDGPWTIGRSRKNSIQLTADPYLSRFHGKIEVRDNVPFVSDLGTRSGILLDGEPVTVHPLRPGHVISMAESQFTFQVAGGRRIFTTDASGSSSPVPDFAEESSSTSFNWSSRSSRSSKSARTEETLQFDRYSTRRPASSALLSVSSSSRSSTHQRSSSSHSSGRDHAPTTSSTGFDARESAAPSLSASVPPEPHRRLLPGIVEEALSRHSSSLSIPSVPSVETLSVSRTSSTEKKKAEKVERERQGMLS